MSELGYDGVEEKVRFIGGMVLVIIVVIWVIYVFFGDAISAWWNQYWIFVTLGLFLRSSLPVVSSTRRGRLFSEGIP